MTSLRFLSLVLFSLFLSLSCGCSPERVGFPPSIIPEPLEMTVHERGTFALKVGDRPAVTAPEEIRERLEAYLLETPYRPAMTEAERSGSRFRLFLRDTVAGIDSPEGYRLSVSGDGVVIEASGEAGLFYGLQTLFALTKGVRAAPFVAIADEPRFAYRGLMIDVSRHFFGVEVLKRQIDMMARLKLNRLHLHLTDAAGWRLQIDAYPRLTALGAWRTDSLWKKWWGGGRRYLPRGRTPGGYGGYFTKAEIRELIRYAALQQITVVPEIEMPGHSEEVLTAYPELSCTHEPYKAADFCAGNEAAYRFLETVLAEVIDLFPSPYIHIGGDEAGKASWKSCPLCRKKMREEGLNDVDELQSYFIRRIEAFVQSKGRRIIGWDEIIDGGLSPDAAVMSWRGTEGGLEAVRRGNPAIMTPGAFCYLDQYQDAPETGREAAGGYLPLEKAYAHEPVPEGLTKREESLILGLQGNLWTEYVPSPGHLEHMLYPRLFAVAETAWSPKGKKDYSRFREKALRLLDEMKRAGYTPFDLSKEIGNRPESLARITHKGRGKKAAYAAPYSESYEAGGEAALTDGRRGGWSFNDGRWQGFIAGGVDVTVDLGAETAVQEIEIGFMQAAGPSIFLPKEVTFYASDDGERYTELARLSHDTDENKPAAYKIFALRGEKGDGAVVSARYIRCAAAPCRPGVWLFADELVIR